MIIVFGLRQMNRGKQKSHDRAFGIGIGVGVLYTSALFLSAAAPRTYKPEQLFVFCFCSHLAHEKGPNQEHLKREIGVLRGKQTLPIDAID